MFDAKIDIKKERERERNMHACIDYYIERCSRCVVLL